MSAVLAYGLAAAAVFAPSALLETAGTLIPAFVTDAHKAAMASLGAPILGVIQKDATDLRALHRANEVCATLVPLRGLLPGLDAARTDLANLTGDDVHTLLTAFLEAVKAGCAVEGGYQLSGVGGGDFGGDFQAKIFEALAGGQDDGGIADPISLGLRSLTSLGAQVKQCITLRDGAGASSSLGNGAAFALSGQLAAKDLANEMDDVGFLIAGAPAEPVSVLGGIAASLGAVGDLFSLGGLTRAAANVMLSLPVLVLVGGLVVYKAVHRA